MHDDGDDDRFPSIEVLCGRDDLRPAHRETVEHWRSLSTELKAIMPHVAELVVVSMGRQDSWATMTEGERNIMTYGIIALLAEAQRRARDLAAKA